MLILKAILVLWLQKLCQQRLRDALWMCVCALVEPSCQEKKKATRRVQLRRQDDNLLFCFPCLLVHGGGGKEVATDLSPPGYENFVLIFVKVEDKSS